jgi:hypothetical protein
MHCKTVRVIQWYVLQNGAVTKCFLSQNGLSQNTVLNGTFIKRHIHVELRYNTVQTLRYITNPNLEIIIFYIVENYNSTLPTHGLVGCLS